MYVFPRLIGTIGKHGHKKLDEPAAVETRRVCGWSREVGRVARQNAGVGKAQGGDGIKEWLSQRIEAMLQTKQLLSVSRLKPGDENHRAQLLRLAEQRQRSKGGPADAPLNRFEEHVRAMLEDLHWTVGPTDVPAALQAWQDTAAELRRRRDEIDCRRGSAGTGGDKGLEDAFGTGSPRAENPIQLPEK